VRKGRQSRKRAWLISLSLNEWTPGGLTHVACGYAEPLLDAAVGRHRREHAASAEHGREQDHAAVGRDARRFVAVAVGQHLRLARGESIGTRLRARTAKIAARKQWMADHLQLRGAVTIDAGASAKLLGEGKSLLPVGVVAVEGEFVRGERRRINLSARG